MKYLTINTGDVMEWGRERMLPGIAPIIDGMLGRPWPQPISGTKLQCLIQPYPRDVAPRLADATMLLMETSDEVVLVAYLLVQREQAAERAWRMMTALAKSLAIDWRGQKPIKTPWLCALLFPIAITLPADTLPMLADFAACLATRICEGERDASKPVTL